MEKIAAVTPGFSAPDHAATAAKPAPRKSWHRRKLARPGEILEAAFVEFSARGFESAHMDDIARRADVTKGTIYLYFRDKEALFGALVHDRISNALADMAARVVASGDSTENKLKVLFAGIGACLAERPCGALLKVMVAESGRFPQLAALYRAEIVQPIAACLTSIGGDVRENELYRLPADQIAQLATAPALLASLGQSPSGLGADDEGIAAAQLNVVLNGCLAATRDYAAA